MQPLRTAAIQNRHVFLDAGLPLLVGSCFLEKNLDGDITLQVRIVGAVLFRMFYETFEKFDDAVQTVHP